MCSGVSCFGRVFLFCFVLVFNICAVFILETARSKKCALHFEVHILMAGKAYKLN